MTEVLTLMHGDQGVNVAEDLLQLILGHQPEFLNRLLVHLGMVKARVRSSYGTE